MTKYFFNESLMPHVSGFLTVEKAFDRNRCLLNIQNLEPVLPIGTPNCSKTLNDICDERSFEIIQKAGDKKIYVFWSGGIDSTTALAGLLKNGGSNKVVVVMGQSSIDEYPEFYYKFIENKIPISFIDVKSEYQINDSNDKYLTDGVIVTGELGDQIFGTDVFIDIAESDPDLIVKNWEDQYRNLKSFSKYQEFAASAPVPIVTMKDFLWWFSYSLKYNYVSFRMLRTSYKFKLEENAFHFFNTPTFNDWSVSTPTEERYPGTDIKKYKQPLKDYIFSFTKDSVYQMNKIKEGSLRYVQLNLNPFIQAFEWRAVGVDGTIYR